MQYSEYTKEQLLQERDTLLKSYEAFKEMNLNLDMSRGKPCSEQLDISVRMLDIVNSGHHCITKAGLDCRNYGLIDGLPSCRKLFSEFIQVPEEQVMVGGNSSLNMMFDTISCFMTKSPVEGEKPWLNVEGRKFLCPVPGYDRHFAITEYYGFEMIPVPMTDKGPDMDVIENLVANDADIKGIWCVPKYSNPQGITYSDETVRRFANLKPAAPDFRIMWDDAYCVHDLADEGDTLISLYNECEKAGNIDLPIIFCSTSKITFPGSGVAAMATSPNNMKVLRERYMRQTIGYDKINQLRHANFFKNKAGIDAHMLKHAAILKPKFEAVLTAFNEKLAGKGIASWTNPNGGYFISLDVYNGCAKRTVALCKEAGVTLTGAGATFPYGNDPLDKNIRIAPTFPSRDELCKAVEILCVCVELAAIEKILAE